MLESFITYEPNLIETEERSLFDSNDIWILGEHYYGLQDFDDIKKDIRSRLWFTYRKNFPPIGGVGPTSDQGWGCMLRCGQMLLAQAMIFQHLNRTWRWDPKHKSDIYANILRMFEDKKDRLFSIHQIAQMGVSEGKAVGEWMGPNTVAHVLKKLSIYDDWTSLAVHVAMDNCIFKRDVEHLCHLRIKPKLDNSSNRNGKSCNLSLYPRLFETASKDVSYWRPLLLIIPLRLGLNNLNSCYMSALKDFFSIKQCLGIIGGRPNHALYFIGYVGDRLLYLDPHECQSTVDLDGSTDTMDDSSYHCSFALHIDIRNIDPSLALAFFCSSEEDFNDLCQSLDNKLLKSSSPPLFELLERRPSTWPPFVPYTGEETPKSSEFTVVESHFDTDEDFEILG